MRVSVLMTCLSLPMHDFEDLDACLRLQHVFEDEKWGKIDKYG